MHAKLNGGRPSRGTTTKKVKKPAAKGKAKKKSKDTVESDTDGEKPEKKKRKVGANNAFMVCYFYLLGRAVGELNGLHWLWVGE